MYKHVPNVHGVCQSMDLMDFRLFVKQRHAPEWIQSRMTTMGEQRLLFSFGTSLARTTANHGLGFTGQKVAGQEWEFSKSWIHPNLTNFWGVSIKSASVNRKFQSQGWIYRNIKDFYRRIKITTGGWKQVTYSKRRRHDFPKGFIEGTQKEDLRLSCS